MFCLTTMLEIIFSTGFCIYAIRFPTLILFNCRLTEYSLTTDRPASPLLPLSLDSPPYCMKYRPGLYLALTPVLGQIKVSVFLIVSLIVLGTFFTPLTDQLLFTSGHRWELPVLHYQEIMVIYPYLFYAN